MSAFCPECGASTGPNAKFCAECGQKLNAGHAPPARPSTNATAERRQLSVMFCDLVGSTTLSGQLDPEDLRDVLRDYHEAATRAIRDFDGYVAEYLGDGLVVYFGYPQAHEDDAERACRAGLRVVDNMATLNQTLESRLSMRLGVRIGIHTGLVVVGEVGAHDVRDVVRVVGETPNIAARVQGEAPVDGVAVSPETRALAGDRIDAVSLGLRVLKGVAQPVEIFEVRGVIDAPSARPSTEIPIVDRIDAQAKLQAAWAQVRAGSGGALVLAGQAGIGKSKVLGALRKLVEREGGRWFESACSPYHQTSALHPVAALLRGELGLVVEGLPAEDRPLISPLLGLEAPSSQLGVAPALARRATNDAILRTLRRLADGRPAVLAIEDTHWADAATQEFLALVHSSPGDRLLVVTTDREAPPDAQAEVVELPPLEVADAARLVELTAGETMSETLRRDLAERADGIPLFATELVRTLLESRALTGGVTGLELRASVSANAIPTRLQDSLMARIDRLGAAKPVAQAAAVIGRTFNVKLLLSVAGIEHEALSAGLSQLADAHVIQRDPEDVDRYVFTHALLRDVAYSSMLRATRRERHRAIASEVIDHFPDVADAEPALVAHHLSEGEEPGRAVEWWRRAAQQANRRSASTDALAALRRAVEQLNKVPASTAKAGDELATYAALGSALAAVKGYGDDETVAAYERAHELAALIPAAPELFPVLFGIVAYATARGDFDTARLAGTRLMTSAEVSGDSGQRIEALFSLGILDAYTGAAVQAVEQFAEAIALYDPTEHHRLAFSYVFDPGVACLRSIGIPLTLLGRNEEARRSCDDAIALAERLQHPFSHASALVFSSIVAALHRDPQRAWADASSAAELADRAGYPFWSLSARILRGWADITDLDDARGAEAAYRATGSRVFVPLWLTLLADAERRAGNETQALQLFGDAALAAAETGEVCWDGLRSDLA